MTLTTDAGTAPTARGPYGGADGMEGRLLDEIRALKPSWFQTWLAPILGTLVGGLLAWCGIALQGRYARHVADMNARNQARAESLKFILKQLNEFYVPLQVLLVQIDTLRKEIHTSLLDSTQHADISFEHFQDADSEGRVSLRIIRHTATKSVPDSFRIIDEMPLLKDRFPYLLPLLGELVAVGNRLSAHIVATAGLVRYDNEALQIALGEYLAHHAVLARNYALVIEQDLDPLPAARTTAYPRRLGPLVHQDSTLLRQRVQELEGSTDESNLTARRRWRFG